MKSKKLIVCISMVLCFCLVGFSFVSADERDFNSIKSSICESVLEDALQVDNEYSLQDKDEFFVVQNDSLTEQSPSLLLNGISSNSGSKYTIRSVKEKENGGVEVTTIIPYHIQQDGTLIDSFSYAMSLSSGYSVNNTVTPTRNMVDISITYTVFYDQYAYKFLTPLYYRHGSLQAYWSASKSLSNVTLSIWYKSCGELHEYPKCLDYENPANSYISGNPNYLTTTLINKMNAVEGTKYYSATGQMPTNRVLYFSKAFDLGHGGWVDIKVGYTLNGKHISASRTDVIYQK